MIVFDDPRKGKIEVGHNGIKKHANLRTRFSMGERSEFHMKATPLFLQTAL